jgi:hypothetical protein
MAKIGPSLHGRRGFRHRPARHDRQCASRGGTDCPITTIDHDEGRLQAAPAFSAAGLASIGLRAAITHTGVTTARHPTAGTHTGLYYSVL